MSERVFERSVIDDVFFCAELDCFRASIPPPADIGDRDTFLRRSLQPMAISLSRLHALSEKPLFLALDHLALVYASDSSVSLHGDTEFSRNYCSYGGKPNMTCADISAMPPLVEP